MMHESAPRRCYSESNYTNVREFSDLTQHIKGDVLTDKTNIEQASRDASIFAVSPSAVIAPRDADDIKKIVSYVNKQREHGEHLSLTARAAGTDMTGGPLTSSLVLDMTRYLNHVVEVGDGYATTEPGVYYRDFEKQTLVHDLLLPSYPASRELCTVGGMVANNSAGEKTLRYGQTVEYVKEVRMVCHDGNEYAFGELTPRELTAKMRTNSAEGELYRQMHTLIESNYELLRAAQPKVSKNSAGYLLWDIYDKERGTFNLAKLITGSQGTLGIITEITFHLIRPKKHSVLLVLFLPNTEQLADITTALLKYDPESLESYDDQTFKIAVRFFTDIIKRLKGNFLKLAFGFLPEFGMVILGGVPKLVILAQFTGDTKEEALHAAQAARKDLKRFPLKAKIVHKKRDREKYWLFRRESFNLLRHHIKGMRTAPFIDDIIVNPEHLPTFLPKLYGILSEYKHDMIYTLAGHVGSGNFHIIPLMDFRNPRLKTLLKEVMERVHNLVLSYHGSFTAEHNDGLIRTPYLKDLYGEDVYRLFEKTKQIFDPHGIFNPHKKVGATWDFAMQYVDIPQNKKEGSWLARLRLTVNWWQAALYELALLSLGVIIGTHFSEAISAYLVIFWLMFAGGSAYILNLWLKQNR